MQQLLSLYEQWCGHAPLKAEKIAKSGSNRQYVRLHGADGRSVIGVIGTSTAENHSFIYLARHFAHCQLPVPEVLAVSHDESRYIQQDLGTCSLYEALGNARESGFCYGQREEKLLDQTIRRLAHIQVEGGRELDYSQCVPPVLFDRTAALFDLNYFKYCFLKATDLPFDEIRLEEDFQQLADDLAGDKSHYHFLYRDFQARNVMLCPGGADENQASPYFIDFQGGMQGPVHYDVASFLWQASARYPQDLRDRLIASYCEELNSMERRCEENAFRLRLRLFVLFRTLQVLGAYGLRGFFERKKYFLDSIPVAISNLRRLLSEGACAAYPYLQDMLLCLCKLPAFAAAPCPAPDAPSVTDSGKALVVTVWSFSYKKGIPEDPSGNGGGYVFDCRSSHNPGRYEQYKHLTGLDSPVISFLEEDGEITTFLESVKQLADTHVRRYLERHFTHLMFSFGCTGGQHRSVYAAQHLAEHLNGKFGIEVRLHHREQHIEQTFKAKE